MAFTQRAPSSRASGHPPSSRPARASSARRSAPSRGRSPIARATARTASRSKSRAGSSAGVPAGPRARGALVRGHGWNPGRPARGRACSARGASRPTLLRPQWLWPRWTWRSIATARSTARAALARGRRGLRKALSRPSRGRSPRHLPADEPAAEAVTALAASVTVDEGGRPSRRTGSCGSACATSAGRGLGAREGRRRRRPGGRPGGAPGHRRAAGARQRGARGGGRAAGDLAWVLIADRLAAHLVARGRRPRRAGADEGGAPGAVPTRARCARACRASRAC